MARTLLLKFWFSARGFELLFTDNGVETDSFYIDSDTYLTPLTVSYLTATPPTSNSVGNIKIDLDVLFTLYPNLGGVYFENSPEQTFQITYNYSGVSPYPEYIDIASGVFYDITSFAYEVGTPLPPPIYLPAPSVPPFNHIAGKHYIFSVDVSKSFGASPGLVYFSPNTGFVNGTPFSFSSVSIAVYHTSTGFAITNVLGLFSHFPDLSTFEFIFSGGSDNFNNLIYPIVSSGLNPLFDHHFITVGNVYCRTYIDAVLYANSKGANIDVTALYSKDPNVIDVSITDLNNQISTLEAEIVNVNTLKASALTSLSSKEIELSTASSNLAICEASKISLTNIISSNADLLQTTLEASSILTI